MNAETMPTIEMPNRDAFIEDDRPDAAADSSMEDCPPTGTVEDGDHFAAAADEAEDTPDPTEAEEQAGGTGGQVIMGDEDVDNGADEAD